MLVFTHWMIADYFIREYDGLQDGGFPLNTLGFRLGNILPDISEMSLTKHYMDDTQQFIKGYEEKVNDTTQSSWNRSIALGVLCHFYSDYFCKYHNNTSFQKKFILIHYAYEIQLHLSFLALNIKEKLVKEQKNFVEKQLIQLNRRIHLKIGSSVKSHHKGTSTFHKSMLEVYDQDKDNESTVKDIVFALLASKQLLSKYLYVVLTPKRDESMLDIFCGEWIDRTIV
jgi:hypothetical protein